MKRGRFIVFEGVGGCGKTTQINCAGKYLKSRGLNVLVTREPGGVEASEKIRQLIFKLKAANVANADHQTALFFAARKLLLDAVIIPSVKAGKIVLSDRYDSSTYAYQGYGEGGNKATIEKFSKVISDGFKPDAIILIRVSAKTAITRKSKDKQGDPFDSESKSYFGKLVLGYDEMARKGWRGIKWYVVNGEKGKREVAKDINVILNKIIQDEKS